MQKENLAETVGKILLEVDPTGTAPKLDRPAVEALLQSMLGEVRQLQREHKVEVALKDSFAVQITKMQARVSDMITTLSFYADPQAWWIHVREDKSIGLGPAIMDGGKRARAKLLEGGE